MSGIYLTAYRGNLSFAHHVVAHNIRQAPTLHVFHDHPQISSVKETVHEVDDVPMLAVLHDENFIDN